MPESSIEDMNKTDDRAIILAFIVRIWREESASKNRPPIWRGHITPIPNGKRQYFTHLGDIPDLIATHLKV